MVEGSERDVDGIVLSGSMTAKRRFRGFAQEADARFRFLIDEFGLAEGNR